MKDKIDLNSLVWYVIIGLIALAGILRVIIIIKETGGL